MIGGVKQYLPLTICVAFSVFGATFKLERLSRDIKLTRLRVLNHYMFAVALALIGPTITDIAKNYLMGIGTFATYTLLGYFNSDLLDILLRWSYKKFAGKEYEEE